MRAGGIVSRGGARAPGKMIRAGAQPGARGRTAQIKMAHREAQFAQVCVGLEFEQRRAVDLLRQKDVLGCRQPRFAKREVVGACALQVLVCPPRRHVIRAAVRHRGYRVRPSHMCANLGASQDSAGARHVAAGYSARANSGWRARICLNHAPLECRVAPPPAPIRRADDAAKRIHRCRATSHRRVRICRRRHVVVVVVVVDVVISYQFTRPSRTLVRQIQIVPHLVLRTVQPPASAPFTPVHTPLASVRAMATTRTSERRVVTLGLSVSAVVAASTVPEAKPNARS